MTGPVERFPRANGTPAGKPDRIDRPTRRVLPAGPTERATREAAGTVGQTAPARPGREHLQPNLPLLGKDGTPPSGDNRDNGTDDTAHSTEQTYGRSRDERKPDSGTSGIIPPTPPTEGNPPPAPGFPEEPRRPSIDEQRLSLADIQAVHERALKASGALDAALDHASVKKALSLDNPLVRARVAELRIPGGDNTIGAPGIEFVEQTINAGGSEQIAYYPVPLIKLVEGFPELKEGFTGQQLTQVEGMLDGLKAAKDSGVLPNLSNRYNAINNDGDALRKI